MDTIFDLAILGAGPAGYTAADKAARSGLSTVLFEPQELGGVCLNQGCIPTKTLLYSAKLYDHARLSEKYGITTENASADLAAMQKRKTKVIKKLTGGIKVKMREAGVTVIAQPATIIGGKQGGFDLETESESFRAKNILICTGATSFIPPIPGAMNADNVLNEGVVTSTELLDIQQVPQSIAIIGGGVIGLEFASLLSSLGTKVSIIEMMSEILPGFDPEISSSIRNTYSKRGVDFYLGHKVTELKGRTVCMQSPDGAAIELPAELILLSVGRKARITGFGLEKIGVECQRGIVVDDRMRTNVPGVYAAGDVTGFSQLAHTASREAEVAVDAILGRDTKMSYDAIPGVVYTNPEIAMVGLTEKQAQDRGMETVSVKIPMQFSGRYVAENEGGDGFIKMIAEKSSGRILGAHMIGNPCSEFLSAACLAVSQGITAKELSETIFPHPSVSEILKEAAGLLN